MIDLVALSALRAIHESGSVVAAAEATGYTPSAVSQQIRRLERQTGVEVLERVGRRVVLTTAGRYLVERGSGVLAELETIRSELQRASGSVAGHLRLGAFSTAMRGPVAPAVGRLAERHPALTVSLVECEPWESIDRVSTGALDLAVVHNWGHVMLVVPEDVALLPMADDVADVIVRADHRLASSEQIRPGDVVDEPWIATPAGTICRQWLDVMHQGTGRAPNVVHQALEFASHVAMVQAGLGIALIPRLGRGALPAGLVAVEAIDPVPSRGVSVVHRRTMASSPAVAAVIAELGASTP